MAFSLTAPRIISANVNLSTNVFCVHSHESNFTRTAHEISQYHVFVNLLGQLSEGNEL